MIWSGRRSSLADTGQSSFISRELDSKKVPVVAVQFDVRRPDGAVKRVRVLRPNARVGAEEVVLKIAQPHDEEAICSLVPSKEN
jgi:hypothetical protein